MDKYEILTKDLKEFLVQAQKGITTDDGGPYNFDSTFLILNGWNEKNVCRSIEDAGLYCRGKVRWIGTGYSINTNGGLGNNKTRVRDKFVSLLKEKGYKTLKCTIN